MRSTGPWPPPVDAVGRGDGRARVVWHTQGSGKSLEMLFYVGKVMRHPALANPTAVLLTDRNDLDDQLFDEVFAPARTLPETPVQATSREHVRELLGAKASGGHRVLDDAEVRADQRGSGGQPHVPAAVGPAQRRGHRRRGAPHPIRLDRRAGPQPARWAAQRCVHRVHRHPDRGCRPGHPGDLRRVHRRLRPEPGGRRRRHRAGLLRSPAGQGGAAHRRPRCRRRCFRGGDRARRGRDPGPAQDSLGPGRGGGRGPQADR